MLLVAAACGGGSTPTAPEEPSHPAAVIFTDPQALAADAEEITALLRQTFERANRVMPVGSIRFTVSVDPGRSIPGWGLGGYTLGPNDVEIVVASGDGLAAILAERLPPIAAHELHHAVRWRGPGPYSTLLEALVFEGLADHFAIELLGSPVPPWADAFPESQTARYLARARPELDSLFDFNAWFFGLGSDLPRWTGYTLGFRLVGDYLATHPGTTAAGLVNTPADVFRPD